MRAVPGRGLGYDALRFLSAPGTPGHALRTDPLPPVSFNYLGQWDGTTTEDGLIRDRLPALGQDHAPDEPRPYLLDVVGMVEDGTLGFTWIFSGEVFDRATVERVAAEHLAALRALLAHCQDPSSGGATPSDFPWPASTRPPWTGSPVTAGTSRMSTRSPPCRAACSSTPWPSPRVAPTSSR